MVMVMMVMVIVMMLGWVEEEGGMEVDNQSPPPDCAARWICNECQMVAPKVDHPHQQQQHLVCAGLPWHCQREDCFCNRKAGGGWPDTGGLWEVLENLREGDFQDRWCNVLLLLPLQVLHPNHAHMLDIKYSYLNILGHSEGCVTSCRKVTWCSINPRCTMSQMTDVQLQTKENLARNFLEIARKILPGISRLKVRFRMRPNSSPLLPRAPLYMSSTSASSKGHYGLSMTLELGEVLDLGMCSVCWQWQGNTYRCSSIPTKLWICVVVHLSALGMHWLSEVRASSSGWGETLRTSQVWKTYLLLQAVPEPFPSTNVGLMKLVVILLFSGMSNVN